MKPKLTVFRFGDIITSMWSKENLESNREYRFMIFCYGLPSHPYQHNPAKVEKLIESGFVLIYPHYLGTWASYGTMSWENCTNTILQTIDFLKGGNGENIYDDSKVLWKVEDITLVGGSFGGAVVLVAGAKSKYIKNIIAVCAPTNLRDHSRIPEETGEPIEKLYCTVKNGWENLWRIPSKEEWDKLVDGSADLNAIDYIEELKNKNVLLIHGDLDNIVAAKRSIDLHNQLKKGNGNHKLIILKNEGHEGNYIIGREDLLPQVTDWLEK